MAALNAGSPHRKHYAADQPAAFTGSGAQPSCSLNFKVRIQP